MDTDLRRCSELQVDREGASMLERPLIEGLFLSRAFRPWPFGFWAYKRSFRLSSQGYLN